MRRFQKAGISEVLPGTTVTAGLCSFPASLGRVLLGEQKSPSKA